MTAHMRSRPTTAFMAQTVFFAVVAVVAVAVGIARTV